MRALFDQSYQLTALLTTEGCLYNANKSVFEILKVAKEDAIGKPFWEMKCWKKSPNLKNKLQSSIEKSAKGQFYRFSAVYKVSEKVNRNFDFSIKPFYDNENQLSYLLLEGRDVTNLHKSLKALAESEEKFRSLFNGFPDPCWILQNGVFIECNLAAISTLGYPSKKDLLFIHPSKISPETLPDGRSSFEVLEEMNDIAHKKGQHKFDWEHITYNGTTLPIEVTLSPFTLNGKPATYCSWRNISERIKAEKEKQKMEAHSIRLKKWNQLAD